MIDVLRTPALMACKIECGEDGGAFRFGELVVVASWGGGWDHVSVSCAYRCPTWAEMEFIRHQFFFPQEVAVQYGLGGPTRKNVRPYCLHWWRPQDGSIPLPPVNMV